MTKKSLIKTLLGVSVLAIGAGSFAVANAKPAADVLAATSSSSSSASSTVGGLTPGNFIYIDITSDSPWYNETYQYAFYFEGTASGSTVSAFSTYAARTDGGTRTWVAKVPTYTGITTWTSAQAYCYDSTSVATNDGHYIAISTALTDSANNIFKPGLTNVIGTEENPAVNVALTQTFWTNNYPNKPYAALWADAFLRDTSIICTMATPISTMLTQWSGFSTGYSAINATAQGFLKSATAVKDVSKTSFTNLVNSAAGRYDYIVGRYNPTNPTITNFMKRTISGVSSAALITPSNSDSSSTLVLGGIAAVAALASGAYFFVRKKKSA
jgi:LPXTG-motif cell wall-anchored protein